MMKILWKIIVSPVPLPSKLVLGEKNKLFVWLYPHQITIRGEMISSSVISKLYTKEKGLGA